MFKKLSFYLFALFFSTLPASNQIPNREMIILLETINYETLNRTLNASNIYKYREILHPVGIGATTISLLIALYQKAAPIIANKSLIKNIIDHQNLFSNFLNLDRYTLNKKYGHFNHFQGTSTLETFRKSCLRTFELSAEVNKMLGSLINDGINNFDQIISKLLNHKQFQGESFEEVKSSINDASTIKSLHLEMRMLTLSNWIDFEQDWHIKQVNEDIFLLIPTHYIKSLNLDQEYKGLKVGQGKFTDLELQLGLKINHMKEVRRSFFEQTSEAHDKKIGFEKSLEQIFITNNDLIKNAAPKNSKNSWSIYLSGHGLSKHPQLEILPQLYDLKKLYRKKLSTPKFRECHKYHKNINPQDDHIYKCAHHDTFKKYMSKLSMLNKEIKKSEPLTHSDNKIDQGMINSLSIKEFKDVLLFFNTSIEASFLYYSSCYSGGSHLIEPYTENGIPLHLKYSVIVGTPAENMSLQEFPFINLPPYFSAKQPLLFEPMDITHIDRVNKKLALTTPLRFRQFFELLRKGIHNNLKNLVLLPYSLHPHIDQFGNIIPQRIANIPLVRLANTDRFQPIPDDNSSLIIDSTTSSKSIIINKTMALIYGDYIPCKITLNRLNESQQIPKLVSMIPGFAMHTFEEISSSTLNIHEVINSFLTFSELASSKIFWIKKLECKNSENQPRDNKVPKTTVLNDVIIMRNVCNSDALAGHSQDRATNAENCAYFSTNSNQEAKLTWDGPLIATDNYSIKPCNLTLQKEECLNYFPKVTSFLSPVLQRI